MTQKNTQPQITTHPAAAVERAAARRSNAAPSSKVVRFQKWRSAIDQSRQAVGYDQSSPIYGKTDLDVLTEIQTLLGPIQGTDGALTLVTELLKRKTARHAAGQAYRS